MHPAFCPPDPSALPIRLVRPAAWEALAPTLPAPWRAQAKVADFKGQTGKLVIVPNAEGAPDGALFGLGEAADPMQIGSLPGKLPAGDWRLEDADGLDATRLEVAWGLGAYRFTRYKKADPKAVRLATSQDVSALVDAVWFARDLVNTPAEDMGPDALEAAARDLAAAHGANVTVITGDELIAQGYPMVHAVGRAAAKAPRYVELTWGRDGARKLALVGKGVTFDSGGLDIKPASGMALMKKDMGGAAAVMALARLIMGAGLDVRLSVHLPLVENAISGSAFRPGDVFRTRKGLTIEIDNTDAEGRLILCDALARACELEPELVIDMATLTGAARVALGPDLAPFYTSDEALAADFTAAAAAASEPVWRMPLWAPYLDDLDSPIADMKNSGGAFAGSITAALFLGKFVTAPSWMHLDIYAWNPSEKPGRPKGGEATAVRALWKFLTRRFAHLERMNNML
jgi:leucyl aminopeptidase